MTIHPTLLRAAATPAEQRYIDLYAGVAEDLPGAKLSKVRAWREMALGHFAALGLPHRRVEEWKYTDLRALMPEAHPVAGLEADAAPVELAKALGSLSGVDAHRVVFVDGVYRPGLSSADKVAQLTVRSFRDVLQSEVGAAKALALFELRERDAIALLASIFATDGALIEVAPNARIEKPLHLVFLTTGTTPVLTALVNAIHIGEGAQVSIVETYAGEAAGQIFAHSRLAIGSGAEVKHAQIRLGHPGKQLSSYAVALGEGTQYDLRPIALGGPLTRAEANLRFEGEGARCHYSGAMLLRDRHHCDFTLVVDHAAPGCESRELVKAVLAERGHGVFQGKVIVQRGAQQTDGKQMANALLLSDDAEFDSKPELEIYADDVVCGHGATAGQIDYDLLFYLRSRGLPEAEARSLLIAAFVGEALDKIEDEALRAALQEKVDAWLAS